MNPELLQAIGVDRLVPESLARWRPLVCDGVLFFLGKLPAPRRAEIMAAQLALPADADPGQRIIALLTQCPTLHKLGQVLARNPSLPEALRLRLQALESMPALTPMPVLLAHIRRELPADAALTIADEALAEASVAAVVPFTWQEDGELRHGVFKVLKPGIEARLRDELAVWLELGAYLEQRAGELGLPPLDYRDTLDSVAELLANEVRIDNEQANLAAAAAFHAGSKDVAVPRLLRAWCTPRMTAMERVFGRKLTDAELPPQARARLADTTVAALLAEPFWNGDENVFFHADPHAGNLLVTDDGRLAVIDWALVARLSKHQREAIVDAVLGGLTLDADRVCRAVSGLGTLPPDHPVLREAVERALQRVRRFELPGFGWMVALLDEVASRTEAGFRKDLILFRKLWATLSGVIRDLAGEHRPDKALILTGLEHFAAELPSRYTAPFGSRAFDTHLSNADLLRLWATFGLVAARYWRAGFGMMASTLRQSWSGSDAQRDSRPALPAGGQLRLAAA
ncbi:MAG: AarF/UbiB family protein [Burkholderiaceae bacterium]